MNITADTYERLYEAHAQAYRDQAAAVGPATTPEDYDLVGRQELALLVNAGLRPDSTLVDLGCGNGRLSVHAIPYLSSGSYIGIDVAPTMLLEAMKRVAHFHSGARFLHQKTERFDLPPSSVDMVCAFSVFTHMEHEDSFRYLRSAYRVVKPGGVFVLSVLPLSTLLGRAIFLSSAEMPIEQRWQGVRCVATSESMIEGVARLAGWEPDHWIGGETKGVHVDGNDYAFGQSVLFLRRDE